MVRAGTRTLGTSPPVVSGSHAAVSNTWVSTVEVCGFAGTRTAKQMAHGSTKVRPIWTSSFTAAYFFGVAHVANRLLRKIGIVATGGQSLQFSTTGKEPRNQD